MIVLPILWDFYKPQNPSHAKVLTRRQGFTTNFAGTVAPSDNIFTALRNCYCVSSIQSIQFLFTITFWENIFLIVLCWDLTEIALFRTIWEFDWCFWFFELLAVQVSLSSFSRSFTVWGHVVSSVTCGFIYLSLCFTIFIYIRPYAVRCR